MSRKYELLLLTPAQSELEEIGLVYLTLAGEDSARKAIDRIYEALEKLQLYPNSGILFRDKQLASQGYRTLICGNFLCVYRLIGNTIYVYHIVDGRSNYPRLLHNLK